MCLGMHVQVNLKQIPASDSAWRVDYDGMAAIGALGVERFLDPQRANVLIAHQCAPTALAL
jgi:hypothetical protein